jgi:tetratricopeptide (TPR) repeat protein
LAEPELEGALLGLGSTYRCLGEYAKSLAVFERAIKLYPENRAFRVFKSLCDYNVGHADVAIRALLTELVETTNSEDIKQYGRALLFYSDKLDQKFE